MIETMRDRVVFFEPWSLGDVMIAAAAARELPQPPAIACHSVWHPLLRRAFAEEAEIELIAVNLPYTTRKRTNAFDVSAEVIGGAASDATCVLSIRGDLRDLAAARRIFPRARIRMNGWVRFFGRKSAIVNLPYRAGLFAARNRYKSWAKLAGVPYGTIVAHYRLLQSKGARNNRVAIHVGAQWRSKQFSEVVALREALVTHGFAVTILAGPGDLLPPRLDENEVKRVADESLVTELQLAACVITNDSGPMHVAAFLGCRTIAVARTSPIEEWAPPAVTIIRSPETPRGYRPHPRYMSDEILPDWPSVANIIASVTSQSD